MYKYLLERIRDGRDWEERFVYMADAPCTRMESYMKRES